MDGFESLFGANVDGIESLFGSILGWKAFSVWLVLQAFGLFYAWLVYIYFPRKKINYNTSLMVAGGTLVTIIGHGVVIGWNTIVIGFESSIVLFICFLVTGWPMIAGYSVRESKIRAAAEARAEKRLMKTNQKFHKLNGKDK